MPAVPDTFAASEFAPLAGQRQSPLIADLRALSGFRSQMAREGLPVNIARMMFDRPYAYERIALAHGSADASLQRLALQLFGQYIASDGSLH